MFRLTFEQVDFLLGQLAQLDRALASGAKGRGFESRTARQ